MKCICIVIFSFISQCSVAQKILVPYRSGNLFGLSDEKGKISVKPAYEHIEWMSGTWFRTFNKVDLKDTLETSPGKFFVRNTTAKLSGLINNGKVILADEPFEDYEIIAGKCIAAKFETRGTNLTKEQFKKYGDKRKQFCLFNLQGKNLYPENFRRIQKMDTAGVSSKNKNSSRYILFWTTSFNDRHSLFVFDADQQEISNWLIKDAYKLQPDNIGNKSKQIGFAVTDSNMNSSMQLLDYATGQFILQPMNGEGTVKNKTRKYHDAEIVEYSSGSGSYGGDRGIEAIVAVPEPEGRPSRPEPAFNPYHLFVKDSLFYMTGKETRKTVALPTGTKIISLQPNGITQYQPVMVRYQDHFYVIKDEKLGTDAYDSLIYFGKYFLAWKKINGQTKAGVIDGDEKEIIPFQFDSLYAGIRYMELKNITPGAKTSNYQTIFRESDNRYSYDKLNPYSRSFDNLLTAFVKGDAGVISIKGDTVIPFNYQLIAKNYMQFSRPKEDDFILLKQYDKYGLTLLQYSKEKKHSEMSSKTVAPVFNYIPGYFFSDYYGIKGFVLVGLYDEQTNFMGFATGKGKTYYDNP